jgi:hypothetical protein
MIAMMLTVPMKILLQLLMMDLHDDDDSLKSNSVYWGEKDAYELEIFIQKKWFTAKIIHPPILNDENYLFWNSDLRMCEMSVFRF